MIFPYENPCATARMKVTTRVKPIHSTPVLMPAAFTLYGPFNKVTNVQGKARARKTFWTFEPGRRNASSALDVGGGEKIDT